MLPPPKSRFYGQGDELALGVLGGGSSAGSGMGDAERRASHGYASTAGSPGPGQLPWIDGHSMLPDEPGELAHYAGAWLPVLKIRCSASALKVPTHISPRRQFHLPAGRIPGRLETYSPSRGERLANLKRLQQEKRVMTASGGARTPSDSGGQGQQAPGSPAANSLLTWSLPLKPGSSPASLRAGGLQTQQPPPPHQQQQLRAQGSIAYHQHPADAPLMAVGGWVPVNRPERWDSTPMAAAGSSNARGGADSPALVPPPPVRVHVSMSEGGGGAGRYGHNPPAGSLSGGASDPLEAAAARAGSPGGWSTLRGEGVGGSTPTGSPKASLFSKRRSSDASPGGAGPSSECMAGGSQAAAAPQLPHVPQPWRAFQAGPRACLCISA